MPNKSSKKARYSAAALKSPLRPKVVDVITAKTDAKKRARYATRRMGKFGSASEVVRIDPAEYPLDDAPNQR